MCKSCGGTCADKPRTRRRARFTSMAGSPAMRVVGTNMGPLAAPIHLVSPGPDTVTYESLYTDLAPNGERAALVHQGTFGTVVRAGRGR